MATRQQFMIITVAIAVLLSGCAGWGTDNPDDELNESEPAQADAPNESDADESNESAGDGSDATASANDSDSESQNQSGDDAASGTEKSESQRSTPEGSSDETPTHEDGQTKDSDSSENSTTDDGTDEKKSDENERESNTHTLSVTVTDPDEQPIEGVTVELSTYPDGKEIATATTDKNGVAEFEVEPGDYEAVVDTESVPYTDYGTHPIEVSDSDESYTVELVHPPDSDNGENETNGEPATHTLTVTVADATGDPVENASVSVVTYDDGADMADGTTDENGEVVFDLEDGSYELAVSTEGLMQPSDQRLVEINGEDTATEVQLQETGSGDDTATGIVRVTDSDGNPIEGEPVKITPPATVTERGTEIEYTDENGEIMIELAAGEPTDVVMYGVEVRGEEQTLGIMSDEHVGVQVVEFQPTDRMYLFETVIYVTDKSGEPVEGVPVEARHGMLGDDPANEWELVGETDENGEVVLTGGSSIPDDVIAKEVLVGDQEPFTTYVEADKRVEEITINQNDDSAQNNATNETDTATPAIAAASQAAVPAG
ncbi:carboxypeptidase regulatory-like domain-containing protein [Halalkalicoccus subterraneus]|uniref:carboxypeptidase regulatory-like domain-containing protein n=1 Tax=Halalkalicoccus subterraneus TaxID=2675002 RepID=UPI000EFD1ECF|nr:carboxypeptidase regulatory-like domain-containing protein [Halalkalicoccus subterraneus]